MSIKRELLQRVDRKTDPFYRLVKQKLSEDLKQIPDNAIRIADRSDAPDGAQIVEGERGGLAYVPENGESESEEGSGTSAAVPDRPTETVEAWDEKHSEAIQTQAEKHDMSEEEYREAVSDEYNRIIENSQAAVRVPSDVLSDVLSDGRVKTQFETGESGGWFDPSLRSEFEEALIGVDEGTSDEDRPVYGYAASEEPTTEGESRMLQMYGDASIRLSDDAKERSTVTYGDSMNANRDWFDRDGDIITAPAPASNPDERTLDISSVPRGADGDTYLEFLQNSDDPTDFGTYNEMQIHGGVSVEDIEQVVFTSDPPQEIVSQLEAQGIEFEVDA